MCGGGDMPSRRCPAEEEHNSAFGKKREASRNGGQPAPRAKPLPPHVPAAGADERLPLRCDVGAVVVRGGTGPEPGRRRRAVLAWTIVGSVTAGASSAAAALLVHTCGATTRDAGTSIAGAPSPPCKVGISRCSSSTTNDSSPPSRAAAAALLFPRGDGNCQRTALLAPATHCGV